jgi:O-Antigen ligase
MPRATQPRIARLGVVVVLLVPSGLLLGLALASGGFFPDSVSVAVVAVILIFTVRAVSSPAPFSGLSPGFSVVAVALIAFAAWTLVSGSWSGSSARATFAYDLALLYTAVFMLTGMLGRSATRARVLLYGLTVVSVGISIAAATTWLLPDLLPVASDIGRARLSWPTSYWNATGLIAALALVWTSSLSCSSTQPARVRVLAAMAAPWPAATLIFTASRGAVAVAALGMVLAAVTIRSSATPGGLATLAPAITLSVAIALAVNGLSVAKPSAHAVGAGQRTVILLVAVALAAAALRMALLRLDARLAGARAPWTRAQFRAALSVAAAVLVVAFLALGGPRAVRAAVHGFVATNTQSVLGSLPPRERLTRLGNNGRIEEWRVAFDDGFLRHPLTGTGAGTYATLWTRYGPTPRRVLNAHSLYLEQLAELGIVGGGVLVAIIASMLVALARRTRGAEREVWAALLAGSVMWAVHAGVDWDWQMPAVTAWFFAAGGLALAAPLDRPRRETQPRVRIAVAFGCLLLAVTPAVVWRSQTQIIKAVGAFERGDCLDAEQAALAANAALGSREDPFEVISYCEAGTGQFSLALSAIRSAELRDPQNWEPRYSDALISAVAGIDPRPAARAALARYPTSPLTRAAVSAFSRGGPRAWRRFAISAPLPLPWVQALVAVPATRVSRRAG